MTTMEGGHRRLQKGIIPHESSRRFHKYFLVSCLWDTLTLRRSYCTKNWPQRSEFSVGKRNVKWQPLIEPHKVLMPQLRIKLGLIKQFVTALDK